MRLNRVLLVAATISIMVFALVFTISCSGDEGPRGKDGYGCIVRENGSNWDIVCTNDDGEEEVQGSLRDGGKPGAIGATGAQGAPGKDCWLGPKTNKGFQVFCKADDGSDEEKGWLDGCSVRTVEENTPYESVITCGSEETHICGQIPFDAKKYECLSGSITPVPQVDYLPCGKQKNAVNPAKQYCGWGPKDIEEPTVVYEICDGYRIHEDSYDEDAYCRYTSEKLMSVVNNITDDYCDGQRINENAWKTQYCGFAAITSTKKTLITGACDSADVDGVKGPNEKSFGQGYCEVPYQWRLKQTTIYSEKLCGTSANNKPNNGAWKNEYCGFADSSATEPSKVYVGLCDDSDPISGLKAPHLEAYNSGYCGVLWDDTKPMVIGTGKTVLIEELCGDNGKPNEGKWKGEYCGYESAASKKADKVYSGICDDGQGPNMSNWNPKEYCSVDPTKSRILTILTEETCRNGDRFNENGWKGEYCGFKDKTTKETSRLTGACDDGDGPHSSSFNGGYCAVDYKPGIKLKAGPTKYSEDFCGDLPASGVPTAANKANEGEWKGEYCGYKSAADERNELVTAVKGLCDDGKGPSAGAFERGFCEYDRVAKQTFYSENWCISGTGTNIKKVSVNKDTWQGQYCFVDNQVKACKGGLEPIKSAKSTDNGGNPCASPSLLAFCALETGATGGTPFEYRGSKKCAKDFANVGAARSACIPGGGNGYIEKDTVIYTQCKLGSMTADPNPNKNVTKADCDKSTVRGVFTASAATVTPIPSTAIGTCDVEWEANLCINYGNTTASTAPGTGPDPATTTEGGPDKRTNPLNHSGTPGAARCEFTPNTTDYDQGNWSGEIRGFGR